MYVTLDSRKRLIVSTHYDPKIVQALSSLPDRRQWVKERRVWVVSPARRNIEHLRENLPNLAWSDDAKQLADAVLAASRPPEEQDISDFEFVGKPPYNHQRKAFALSRGAPAYALLMEQRTGKSRVFVDTARDLWAKGEIDLVIVICPNSVKSVWTEEQIPEWTNDRTGQNNFVVLYEAAQKHKAAQALATRDGRLQWLVLNCEALATDSGKKWLEEIVKGRKVLCGIDEASRFKSTKSARSKNLLRLRKYFQYRRLLTGTLITQGPLDAYVPFAFLDPAILGYSSYYAFRNDYAVFGGWNQKELLGYKEVEKLAAQIKPFSFRITRDECYDMPPKQYEKLVVELSSLQQIAYNQMRDQMIAEVEGAGSVRATIVVVQMLRLQQIVGGFVANEDGTTVPIPGPNPKLERLLEDLEEIRGKAIIWCRFRAEIALIAQRLRELYGENSVAEFHGGISADDRLAGRQAFQTPRSPVRWFVGQTETGGLGIPLHITNDVFYFSNSFSLESRLQTEDRAQAIGKTDRVCYTDIVAKDTLDVKRILPALRGKKHWADVVNGDTLREWI